MAQYKTERLLIRNCRLEDAEFMFELYNSPKWIEFIGDRNIKTIEDARNYLLNGVLKMYDANGLGLYIVHLKESKIPIGICSLIKRDYLDFPDIGFAFLPEYEGKGYALEATKATLTYSKNHLGLDRILAISLEKNIKSISLLEKLGLRFERIINAPDDEEELMLFSMEL